MNKLCIFLSLLLNGCFLSYDVPSFSKRVSNVDFDNIFLVTDKVYEIRQGQMLIVPFSTENIKIYNDAHLTQLLFSITSTELLNKESEFIQNNKEVNYTDDAIFITKKGIEINFKDKYETTDNN